MNISKITRDFRLSEWLQVMKEHKVSGMSVKDFCEQRGIKKSAYYYWQRKLREQAGNAIIEQTTSNALAPDGWLQLKQEANSGETLEVMFNGFSISVGIDTDPGLLRKICSILRTVQ